jgi:RNA polymerase sigma-70 factor (ECF subfamily)
MPRFESTHWSIVLQARGATADARAALDRLCRTYRPPVLAYIRGRTHSADAAEDLAQTFFTRFIEDAYHADADPTRGRFRAFLLTALKRFLINAHVESQTLKRGGGVYIDRLDDGHLESDALPASSDGPEQAFERSWAMTVLDAALRRLRAEADVAGKTAMFDQLREFLTEAPDQEDYTRAAAALKLRRNTVAVAVHRLRHRMRELVRQELRETTQSRDDLENELRDLRATLSEAMPAD